MFFDESRLPLKGIPAAMQERRMAEIQDELAANGLTMGDVNADGSINISLRNFEARHRTRTVAGNGTGIDAGETNALIAALNGLGVCRVDLEAADISRLNGRSDILSHAVARGVESGVGAVTKHTSSLAPEEIFDGLEKAASAVFADGAESPEVREYLQTSAEADLRSAGLLDGPDPWEAFNERFRTSPEPPERSGEFADSATPAYRSPFAESF